MEDSCNANAQPGVIQFVRQLTHSIIAVDRGTRPESSGCMQLRDHPLMSYHRQRNWPPVWSTMRAEPFAKPHGEVGILKEAMINDRFDNTVYLKVKIDGRDYLGTLLFDDFGFYYEIYSLLKSRVGCSTVLKSKTRRYPIHTTRGK